VIDSNICGSRSVIFGQIHLDVAVPLSKAILASMYAWIAGSWFSGDCDFPDLLGTPLLQLRIALAWLSARYLCMLLALDVDEADEVTDDGDLEPDVRAMMFASVVSRSLVYRILDAG